MRVLKYIVACAAVLALAGCEKGMNLSPSPQVPGDGSHEEDIVPSVPSKPTSPIKKRPIVPTTKLPRPRFAEEYATAEAEVYEAEAYEAEEWDYCEEW